MASPDLTDLVTLTLYDATPSSLVSRALTDATSKLPGWIPAVGDEAVVQLEAMSLIVAEMVYAINRVPAQVLDVLLQLYGVTRSTGVAPTGTVTFTTTTSQPLNIPGGSIIRLVLADGSPLDFTTNAPAAGPGPTLTVPVTATVPTAGANGIVSGTSVQVISPLPAVDSATLGSNIAAGANPEDEPTWRTRGVQLLSRLTSTLVSPTQFQSAALSNPLVYRAITLDNYTPAVLTTPTGVTATPSTTGGTLTAATYSYRVAAVNVYGATLASAAVTAVTTGTTGSVLVGWSPVVPANGAGAVTGYRVYGRVGGSEGLLATVTATNYTDTGAATVGAVPGSTNTTGGTVGAFPGYETVAVLGLNGAFLSATDKTSIQTTLQAQAEANLNVQVIDPTITSVTVTATVHPLTGYSAAQVQTNVAAALTTYLNPNAWLWAGTVRINKLIQIIEEAAGVDYVTSISAPAADLVLAGVAPLVSFNAAASVITVA